MACPSDAKKELGDSKHIYFFGEGSKDLSDLLGGKGANLNEMTRIGLPVPPGFTITTEAYKEYSKKGELTVELQEQIKEAVSKLERLTDKHFGGKEPLIISVRSGAKHSMPGMLETILNLGLNDMTVKYLAEQTNQEFAYDCYKKLMQKFSGLVFKKQSKYSEPDEFFSEIYGGKTGLIKEYIQKTYGKEFPQDVNEQLMLAIKAVFDSWKSKKAKEYRKLNSIPNNLGTAVNIQAMVFGNKGRDSYTGVLFTRSPVDGKNEVYGEYLAESQGEDLVSGSVTPEPIGEMKKQKPELYHQLVSIAKKLEGHFKNVQDIEFTIEDDKLWILQTRKGNLSSQAELQATVDMVNEGLITKKEAINRLKLDDLKLTSQEEIDPAADYDVIAKGVGTSFGIVSGEIVLSSKKAEKLAGQGRKCILVRKETSPEDIKGIECSVGILTQKGGSTSHAALVARAMNKCCVTGCKDLRMTDEYFYTSLNKYNDEGDFYLEHNKYREGELISLNGYTGEVIKGQVKTVKKEKTKNLEKIIKWSGELIDKKLDYNVDTPKEIREHLSKGSKNIGLCRTDYLFLIKESLDLTLEYKAKDSDKESLLKKMEVKQKDHYKKILDAAKDDSIRIMLLSYSLSNFQSKKNYLKENITNKYSENMKKLHLMQVRALTQAYSEIKNKPKVEILIPEIVPNSRRKKLKTLLEEITSKNENIAINPYPERICLITNMKNIDYGKIGKAETIITKPKNLDLTKVILAKYVAKETK